MPTLIPTLTLRLALLTALSALATAVAAETPPAPFGSKAPAARPSPFVEFAVAERPREAGSSRVGGNGAVAGSGAAKPRFEMVISTPVSNFGHMRAGSSNALLECIIPSGLRRDQ